MDESDSNERAGGDKPAGSKAERTRARILRAAEDVFGERGFHEASIVEITQRADVAQGTFYVHFTSKYDIFEELILIRGRELRETLHAAARGAGDRHELERAGFRAYFEWILQHPGIYRVARQADFVKAELTDSWYRTFVDTYTKVLARSMEDKQIADGDPEVTAWAIMGMAEFVALRYIVWKDGKAISPEIFEAFCDIALRALGRPE